MAGVPPKKDNKALIVSAVGFIGSFIYMGAQYVVDNPDNLGSLIDSNMAPTVTMVCTLITGLYKAFSQNKPKPTPKEESPEEKEDDSEEDVPVEEGKE